MHLRFDAYGASLAKENRHPQKVMRDLEISWVHSTPQSMADQWWFWGCTNVPKELPNFIEELKLDPMKCIGNGLTLEEAQEVRQECNNVRVNTPGE